MALPQCRSTGKNCSSAKGSRTQDLPSKLSPRVHELLAALHFLQLQPYSSFYHQNTTGISILLIPLCPVRKPAKQSLTHHVSAQLPFFLPLSHCFPEDDVSAPWLHGPTHMMYVRTAASSYAAHMLFGLADFFPKCGIMEKRAVICNTCCC